MKPKLRIGPMNIRTIMLSIAAIAYFLGMAGEPQLTISLVTMIVLIILLLLGFKFISSIREAKPPNENFRGSLLREIRVAIVFIAVVVSMGVVLYGGSMLCLYLRE